MEGHDDSGVRHASGKAVWKLSTGVWSSPSEIISGLPPCMELAGQVPERRDRLS